MDQNCFSNAISIDLASWKWEFSGASYSNDTLNCAACVLLLFCDLSFALQMVNSQKVTWRGTGYLGIEY